MKPSPSFLKQYWKHITIFSFVIIYVAINLFRIGGDEFVINLNNNIANPLALGVTFLAFLLWRQLGTTGKNRLLWSGLTLGWALWTVAEFWWGIAAFTGKEIPYPSGADFFWLAGYIPMYIALWERSRSLPKQASRVQKAVIWFSIIFSAAWTIWFVLIPAIQASDSTAILESILGIVYPLADLIILILVLRIFFTYRQGMYGRAWSWISAGFVLTSLSDLIFLYVSAIDLYYPDGQANLISTLGIEVPYALGYLCWMIGLFIVHTIQKSHQTFTDTHIPLKLVPNTHILVFTKEDDSVTSVSLNYWRVYQREFVQGKKLTDVLDCSPADIENILKSIKTEGVLRECACPVQTRFGPQQALVSGISAAILQSEYSGVILLLRMYAEDYSLDNLLTEYHHGMVRSLLDKTGAIQNEVEEIRLLLTNYHLSFLRAYYNHVFSEGGSLLAETFITELQTVARAHNWQIGIRPDSLLDTSALSLSTTQEALPILAETARQLVVKISDETTANMIVENVRSHFDEAALKNVAYFEKVEEVHI